MPDNSRYADPQRITLFQNRDQNTGGISGRLTTKKQVIIHEFFMRHYFNVIQFSVTKQRHRYWERVDEMINRTGTIFTGSESARLLKDTANLEDDALPRQPDCYLVRTAIRSHEYCFTGKLPHCVPLKL